MRAERGFTLVELLVALSILGLVTVLGAGLFHLGTRSWSEASQASENTATLDAVQSVLRQELTSAIPVARLIGNTWRVQFTGTDNSVEFHAALPQALGGAQALIRLFVEREGGLTNLTMAWRPAGASQWQKSILLSGIKAAHYQYYGSAAEGKAAAWYGTWPRLDALPRAIELEIEFPDRDKRTWPELIVGPLISVDVNCIYDITSKKCFGR